MQTTDNTIHMPVLGFGTLIPDAAGTISATRDALEAGFRHFDCAERYRNESVARLCLPRPELPRARERISTSLPCRKRRLRRSSVFRPGSGLTRSYILGYRASLRETFKQNLFKCQISLVLGIKISPVCRRAFLPKKI